MSGHPASASMDTSKITLHICFIDLPPFGFFGMSADISVFAWFRNCDAIDSGLGNYRKLKRLGIYSDAILLQFETAKLTADGLVEQTNRKSRELR
jgi:hypothetical protein